jgi:hypothetical protein
MLMLDPNRIDFEETIVNLELPGFRRYDSPTACGFKGSVTPKTGSRSYELKLDLPITYPYSKPNLFVTQPRVLWMRGGKKSINSMGTTHAYHAYRNGRNGCVKICHTCGWDSSFSCVQVLLKGLIYVEAYSIHLLTGATIAEIIDSFEEYYTIWSNPLIL